MAGEVHGELEPGGGLVEPERVLDLGRLVAVHDRDDVVGTVRLDFIVDEPSHRGRDDAADPRRDELSHLQLRPYDVVIGRGDDREHPGLGRPALGATEERQVERGVGRDEDALGTHGSGVPGARLPQARERPDRGRGAAADGDQLARVELEVRLPDGVVMDPELRTQLADRRQAFAGGQGSRGDQPRQLLLQLRGDRDRRAAVEHDASGYRGSRLLDTHHSVISRYNSQEERP